MSTHAPLPRCFGVFGQPVAHSRSPAMHGAAFELLGLPHRYMAFAVAPERLPEAVRGAAALGFGGVNLTVPHKQAALELCDTLAPNARRIGAVNTLRFDGDGIHGHNTDGAGFLAGLDELEGPPPTHATVLGAGGASLAIVDALLERFPALELTWVSRDPARIEAHLAAGIGPGPDARARVRPCAWASFEQPRGQLLVNTTIVGLAGGPAEFPRPVALDGLDTGARVIDIVYPRPSEGLLARADGAGLATQDGLPMLLWQGVRALELWLSRSLSMPAVTAMREALHR